MRIFLYFLIPAILFSTACKTTRNESVVKQQDTLVMLQNETMSLTFSIWGGALIDFHLKNENTNPFTWKVPQAEMPENNRKGAPFQGHFLCLGRWGGPTPGEIKSGIPHNGEACGNWWELTHRSPDSLTMSVGNTLEAVEIERKVTLAPNDPVFMVTEVFTNRLNIARNLPIVQHATIGTPFLDSAVIIESNARQGFNQKFVPGTFRKLEAEWPTAKTDSFGNDIDVRKSSHSEGFVATYTFSGSNGWITAYNPKLKLILGYVWKTSDYPWLHLWHGIKDGKLWAKGLEFGTTGLGDNSPLEERFMLNFHGTTNLNYVDANTSVKKSYLCFLVNFNEEIKEIHDISVSDTTLIISHSTIKGLRQRILRTK